MISRLVIHQHSASRHAIQPPSSLPVACAGTEQANGGIESTTPGNKLIAAIGSNAIPSGDGLCSEAWRGGRKDDSPPLRGASGLSRR
jgi:hypothetical protein